MDSKGRIGQPLIAAEDVIELMQALADALADNVRKDARIVELEAGIAAASFAESAPATDELHHNLSSPCKE